jgi:hypothetical protein
MDPGSPGGDNQRSQRRIGGIDTNSRSCNQERLSGEIPYRAFRRAGAGVEPAWDRGETQGDVVIREVSRRVDKKALPLPSQ